MVSNKKVIFFTLKQVTAEEIEFGKAIRAQFRDSVVAGQNETEECDYVAGHIPGNYSHFPEFPADAAEALTGSTYLQGVVPPEGSSERGNSGPAQDLQESNLTLGVLDKMGKDELLDLASQYDEMGLTRVEKKSAPKLRVAIAEYLEILE